MPFHDPFRRPFPGGRTPSPTSPQQGVQNLGNRRYGPELARTPTQDDLWYDEEVNKRRRADRLAAGRVERQGPVGTRGGSIPEFSRMNIERQKAIRDARRFTPPTFPQSEDNKTLMAEMLRRKERATTPRDRAQFQHDVQRASTDPKFAQELIRNYRSGSLSPIGGTPGHRAAQYAMMAGSVIPSPLMVPSMAGLAAYGAANIAQGFKRRQEGLPGGGEQMAYGAADLAFAPVRGGRTLLGKLAMPFGSATAKSKWNRPLLATFKRTPFGRWTAGRQRLREVPDRARTRTPWGAGDEAFGPGRRADVGLRGRPHAAIDASQEAAERARTASQKPPEEFPPDVPSAAGFDSTKPHQRTRAQMDAHTKAGAAAGVPRRPSPKGDTDWWDEELGAWVDIHGDLVTRPLRPRGKPTAAEGGQAVPQSGQAVPQSQLDDQLASAAGKRARTSPSDKWDPEIGAWRDKDGAIIQDLPFPDTKGGASRLQQLKQRREDDLNEVNRLLDAERASGQRAHIPHAEGTPVEMLGVDPLGTLGRELRESYNPAAAAGEKTKSLMTGRAFGTATRLAKAGSLDAINEQIRLSSGGVLRRLAGDLNLEQWGFVGNISPADESKLIRELLNDPETADQLLKEIGKGQDLFKITETRDLHKVAQEIIGSSNAMERVGAQQTIDTALAGTRTKPNEAYKRLLESGDVDPDILLAMNIMVSRLEVAQDWATLAFRGVKPAGETWTTAAGVEKVLGSQSRAGGLKVERTAMKAAFGESPAAEQFKRGAWSEQKFFKMIQSKKNFPDGAALLKELNDVWGQMVAMLALITYSSQIDFQGQGGGGRAPSLPS